MSRPDLRTFLKWLLSGGLLALVLWRVPLDEVVSGLAQADVEWVLIGMALFFAMRIPPAWRMHSITQQQTMSLSRVEIYKIGLVTSFFGLFLPGYIAGGAIRWHMLSQNNKGIEALAAMAFDRVNDTVVLMSLGCLCLLLETSVAVPAGALWILAACLATLLIIYSVLLSPWSSRFAPRLFDFPLVRRSGWVTAMISHLTESLDRFHAFGLATRIRLFGLSLLSHVLGTLMYGSLARSLDLDLALTTCGWLRAVLQLLFLMPLSVGGIGVRETALILLLAPLGVSSAQAVAYSFLLTVGLLLIAAAGATLAPQVYLRRRISR